MKVSIYCLYDSIECKIRYIGRTTKPLKIRLIEHISKSQNSKIYHPNRSNSHKENWINKIISENRKPSIKLLCIINGWKESHEFESQLIEKYRNKLKLTNSRDFGVANVGYKLSDFSKNKISEGLKKHFKTHRNPISKYIEICDLKGKRISTAESIMEASKRFKVHKSGITKCLNGKALQWKGYRFAEIVSDFSPIRGIEIIKIGRQWKIVEP